VLADRPGAVGSRAGDDAGTCYIVAVDVSVSEGVWRANWADLHSLRLVSCDSVPQQGAGCCVAHDFVVVSRRAEVLAALPSGSGLLPVMFGNGPQLLELGNRT
jgi:hypothetical protein